MEQISMKKFNLIWFCIIALIASCNQSDYSPKPRGYFKIDFPKKEYQQFDAAPPYTFQYPVYAKMYMDSTDVAHKDWYNLTFPQFNARLHISYYKVNSVTSFNELVEDSRKLAFKHTVKATSIDEARISSPQKKVYGVMYNITGNTASSIQFLLTDSTKNYLRGALYFNEQPRLDSIQPVLDFLKKDINKMIGTLEWKNK